MASTAGSRLVALDPVIAALLGITSVPQAFSRTVLLPTGQLSLKGTTKNSTLMLTAFLGPSSGNGVTLAAATQTFSATYGYLFSKRLTGSFSGRFARSSNLGYTAENYSIYSTGFNADYQARPNIAYTFNTMYRHSTVRALNLFGRDVFEVGIGIGWNSSDFGLLH